MLRRAPRYRFAHSDFRASTLDAIGHGGMVGFGETYIPAFVLALGMGEVVSGLITTLPMLAGGALQLLAPYGAFLLRSRRRWVVTAAAAQSVSFLPLIWGALQGEMSRWAVFLAVSGYWTASLATGSVWTAWIDTLVPTRLRPTYFAYRSRLAQVALVAGIVVGGILLHQGAATSHLLLAFAIVFTFAAAGRAISAISLWMQREPVCPSPDGPPLSIPRAAMLLGRSPAMKLILLLWLVQASVHVSGPFFNAFMLVRLQLSYCDYLIVLATAFLAKIVALSFLGGLARRIGVRRLFWLGSIGIVPLPVLWLVSHEIWFLELVQVLSGVAWGAYELGMFLLLFEEISPKRRTESLTIFNAGLMIATAAGSLVGVLLMQIPTDPMIGYAMVFSVSAGGRLCALGLHRAAKSRSCSTRVEKPRPVAFTCHSPAIPRSMVPTSRG